MLPPDPRQATLAARRGPTCPGGDWHFISAQPTQPWDRVRQVGSLERLSRVGGKKTTWGSFFVLTMINSREQGWRGSFLNGSSWVC